MNPQVGQIWKIKDQVFVPKKISRYIFIVKIGYTKFDAAMIYFNRIGSKNVNNDRPDTAYLKWMVDNTELVSG
jgi:hypothetical protein